jgi:hypothetical protein
MQRAATEGHRRYCGSYLQLSDPADRHQPLECAENESRKWADQPNLVMTYASVDLALRTAFEFKARAWVAATHKARELGWIV